MFIYNVKLNSKSIVKILLITITLIVLIFFIYSIYRIITESFKVRDSVSAPEVTKLTCGNYTDVLKAVHDNLNDYIGYRFSFSGYVYRLDDFSSNQFVLARDMIISSNLETLIVGFLCESNNASQFENNSWVEVTGEIVEGNYHNPIPVLKITKIKKIDKPTENIYVYPPDENYIPTSVIF